MLGGRTNHWARHALRNGPYDFKPYSRDGLGFDWPISYDDVAPYYDKVEMLIGVFGTNSGLENTPDSPEGCLLPPPKARIGELLASQRGRRLGIPVMPIRRAVLTRPLDHRTIPAKLHPGNAKAQRIIAEDMQNRAACFWATSCGRGCSIRANYQSTTVHLPPAMATGNLDILVNSMVRSIKVNAAGKATGVVYIDKTTGAENHASARAVVLAASACETVRVLLNSKSAQFPNGVGNSSGLVGKYIMDTVGANWSGQIPLLENLPPHNEDGAGGLHVYAPWWLYKERLEARLCPRLPHRVRVRQGDARGLRPVHARPQRPHQLRRQDEGGRPPLLWLPHRILRPRRDDPERGFILRAGPQGRRQVGDPGPAVQLEMVRARDPPGRAHAEDLRRLDRGDGRDEQDEAGPRRPQGDRRRWIHHPRGRRHDHGRRPGQVGDELRPGRRGM